MLVDLWPELVVEMLHFGLPELFDVFGVFILKTRLSPAGEQGIDFKFWLVLTTCFGRFTKGLCVGNCRGALPTLVALVR